MGIEHTTRNAVNVGLKEFCFHANENAFMEVTEWSNCEGVDIFISTNQDRMFSLTWGEVDALDMLTKCVSKRLT